MTDLIHLKKETADFLIDLFEGDIELEEMNIKGLAQQIVDVSRELNDRINGLTIRRARAEEHVAKMRKIVAELKSGEVEEE